MGGGGALSLPLLVIQDLPQTSPQGRLFHRAVLILGLCFSAEHLELEYLEEEANFPAPHENRSHV